MKDILDIICQRKSVDAVHFYLDRTKGYGQAKALDIQKVDLGIALCHFETAAKYTGLDPVFSLDAPDIADVGGMEYIATYKITK